MKEYYSSNNIDTFDDTKIAGTALVVDDSAVQRKLISGRLKQWGYQTYEAAGGQEALNLCRHQHFELVLSDWLMPGMSGVEFCQEFRKLTQVSYGYFILLTSKSSIEDIAMGLDAGADDFLSKPVDQHELRARLRAGQRVIDMHAQLKTEVERSTNALRKIEAINSALNKDLRAAEKLQCSLIPQNGIESETYRISNLFKSSGHVGGDLVGTFKLSHDRVAIYSIDVAGHGVSSALMTMRLHALLSPFSRTDNVAFDVDVNGNTRILSANAIAKTLNERMIAGQDSELYFTMAYADINLKTGQVQMVQAGHAHPILLPQNGPSRHLGEGGLPIGLVADADWPLIECFIKQGDKLLLYSDGLVERQNIDGVMLDDEGLARILDMNRDLIGEELLSDLLWQVTEYAQGTPFDDDVSAILFEYF